ESRDLTSTKTISRKRKTSSSIEKALLIGAAGYFGSMCSTRKKAVTGPAIRWFRISVNQSCSGIRTSGNPSTLPCDSCEYFVYRFAGDRSHGQKQAREQASQARG